MSRPVPGVTHCPRCEQALGTDGIDGERPVQDCTRSCLDCSYETTVTLLWFPTQYEVLGPVPDDWDDTVGCDVCDEPCSYGVATTRAGAVFRCSEHLEGHRASALDG